MRTAEALIAEAHRYGFDAAGLAPARLPDYAEKGLLAFLEAGWQGDMAWMADTAARRRAPRRLWPGACSILAVGTNYTPPDAPLRLLDLPECGNVSVYARGDDYHDILKRQLRQLARHIAASLGTEVKIFVDTAPLMEKPLAQLAGLGWQGKHTNLVSRKFGSWLFLGAILIAAEIEPGQPGEDHCGNCRRCLDICPTNAFPAPYKLDARRCISYLTIEHKGHIPVEFRKPIGNRIYGCDDCLAVCPWNKFAQAGTTSRLAGRIELQAPKLRDLAALDEAAFREVFRKSPIKRTGRARFVRNVLIAIGNSGDPALIPSATALLTDPSPLVRAMAVWALGQLEGTDSFVGLRDRHRPDEPDPAVRAEWDRPTPIAGDGETSTAPRQG